MTYPKISKNQVKFIQSIKLKKNRQKYNKYSIEGHKIISDLISEGSVLIDLIVGTEKWLSENTVLLGRFDGNILSSSEKNMEMMSQFKSAAPVLILCSNSDENRIGSSFENLLEWPVNTGKYLYVEDIQDPGNLGTIFRTADWYGMDGLFLSSSSVDIQNSKVIQSSMGSVFRVPCRYISDEEFAALKFSKIATTLQGNDLSDFNFPDHFIICMGNEGRGLRPKTVESCDENILITKQHSLGAESLNVAISAAVLMHACRSPKV